MKQELKNSMEQVKPWSRRTPWWVLLVEGILAIGLGIYALVAPQQAQGLVLFGIALVLAVNGLIAVFGGLRGRRRGNLSLIRGAIGLVVGLIVILMPVFKFGTALTAAWILAIGLILAGVMALLAIFMESKAARWGNLIIGVLFLVLGSVIVYNVTTGADIVQVAAWVLVAFGLLLLAYSFFVRSSAAKSETPAAAPKEAKPAVVAAPQEPEAPATAASTVDAPPASDEEQAQAQKPVDQ